MPQKEMFYESHRKVAEKNLAIMADMIATKARDDADAGLDPRYPKNEDYMRTYRSVKKEGK